MHRYQNHISNEALSFLEVCVNLKVGVWDYFNFDSQLGLFCVFDLKLLDTQTTQRYSNHHPFTHPLQGCLKMDESTREDCGSLLESSFFTASNFHLHFPDHLRLLLEKEAAVKKKRKERNHQHRKPLRLSLPRPDKPFHSDASTQRYDAPTHAEVYWLIN